VAVNLYTEQGLQKFNNGNLEREFSALRQEKDGNYLQSSRL